MTALPPLTDSREKVTHRRGQVLHNHTIKGHELDAEGC